MIVPRGTANRATLPLAQRRGLAIVGTLAVVAVAAGVRTEWTRVPPGPPLAASALPSLTAGGKFAVRVAGGDSDDFVTQMTLPAILPMFTAPTVPDPIVALDVPAAPTASLDGLSAAPPRTLRHTAQRRDPKQVAAAPVELPRRGAPAGIVMAALPDLSGTAVADSSLWMRSKTVYRQMVAWSGMLAEHVLP